MGDGRGDDLVGVVGGWRWVVGGGWLAVVVGVGGWRGRRAGCHACRAVTALPLQPQLHDPLCSQSNIFKLPTPVA